MLPGETSILFFETSLNHSTENFGLYRSVSGAAIGGAYGGIYSHSMNFLLQNQKPETGYYTGTKAFS
jgi:hypothetical protein